MDDRSELPQVADLPPGFSKLAIHDKEFWNYRFAEPWIPIQIPAGGLSKAKGHAPWKVLLYLVRFWSLVLVLLTAPLISAQQSPDTSVTEGRLIHSIVVQPGAGRITHSVVAQPRMIEPAAEDSECDEVMTDLFLPDNNIITIHLDNELSSTTAPSWLFASPQWPEFSRTNPMPAVLVTKPSPARILSRPIWWAGAILALILIRGIIRFFSDIAVQPEPCSMFNRSGEGILIPDKKELFTPARTEINRAYRLTFQGVYQHCDHAFGFWEKADAFYREDDNHNFLRHYCGIYINDKHISSTPHYMIEEDRYSHTYVIDIDGTGHKLALTLRAPSIWFKGQLNLFLELLPADVPTVAQRQAQEARQRERRAAEKELRQKAEVLQHRVRHLRALAYTKQNWADPQFRLAFAQQHGSEIMCRRKDIVEEFLKLRTQDPELYRFMQVHYPHDLKCLEGALETLLIAERPVPLPEPSAPPPLPAPAPRRKLSEQDVRNLKVSRQQRSDTDKVELFFNRLETQLKVRERTSRYDLSQDERDMIEQQIMELLDEDDNEGQTI